MEDDGELEYMDSERFQDFSTNLQKANQDDSNLSSYFKKVNLQNNFKDCFLLVTWAGHEVTILNSKEDYFVDLAREEYGSAVRDNTKEELINLGKILENEK
jgi:hypothetical protein